MGERASSVTSRFNRFLAIPLAGVLALGMAACADRGSRGAGSDAAGVAAGATKEEYIAALEGVDPINLRFQIANATGSNGAKPWDAWAESVKEWSGGKISIEVLYSNSVVGATETSDALRDGRLDVANVTQIYYPSQFPLYTAVSEMSHKGSSAPVVGPLATAAAFIELSMSSESLVQEFERNEQYGLFPYSRVDNGPGLACLEPRTDLNQMRGAQARAGSQADAVYVEALGMTPVSGTVFETFEMMQRGVVDCTVTITGGALTAGVTELAPHWVLDSGPGFDRPVVSTLTLDLERWENLPLPARQLMHDRLDVTMEQAIRTHWADINKVLSDSEKAGGSVTGFTPEVKAAFETAHKQVDDRLRQDAATGKLVDDTDALLEKWQGIVTGELGYDESVQYGDFTQWYAANAEVDLTPFIDRFRSEILDPTRPS